MEKENLQALVEKYMRGEATAAEKETLRQWYDSFHGDRLTTEIWDSGDLTEEALRLKMLRRLQGSLSLSDTTPRKAQVRKLYTRWTAAAAVILLLAGSFYFARETQKTTAPSAASITNEAAPPPTPILPGGNKALLQLADGRTIELDAAGKGLVAKEGLTSINLVADGQLSYQSPDEAPHALFYNTLTTPRGGQYQVTLPDGTRVWLNALSSIRFPTSFNDKERQVTITGEAYLEVAPDPSRPFIVQFRETEVTVLGTQFNINAYADEPMARTTLLEGRIRIRENEQEATLAPGQQALTQAGHLQVKSSTDLEAVVAWKNGFFEFTNTDIETLLRQAARWYNIDFTFRGEKPKDRFTGRIPRNVNLSEFLKILAYSDVHFQVTGRQIIIQP